MAEAKQQNVSMEPSHRFNLLEVNWEDVNEPGAYVEKGTGDLFRIPKEALVAGGSPIVMKESSGGRDVIAAEPFANGSLHHAMGHDHGPIRKASYPE